MRNTYLLLLLAILGCKQTTKEEVPDEHDIQSVLLNEGSIEVLDPRMSTIVSKEAAIEVLAEGHEWAEGPVWIEDQQMLLYSDIPRNAVFSWTEEEGSKIYLEPSGFMGEDFLGSEPGSNGLLLDADGRLILCQHGERRVARMESTLDDPKPLFSIVIDNYKGSRLNSPNDAVFKSNGDLYFTDPPYGLPQRMTDPEKELSFQGVYKHNVDGELHLLTDELSRPNGIAFSPDEKILYVANSDPEMAIWKAFDVEKDGSLSNGRIFYDVTDRVPNEKGLPDGLKVNDEGIIFATGPGGVLIFHPDGTELGIIRTGQATANCAFNADQSELFITADMYLLRVDLR
jgi:gluconolactonase